MSIFSPDLYVRAAHFAALAHGTQKMPGLEIPYIVHPCSVAMEVILALTAEPRTKPDLAVACALLHDVVEDTSVGLDRVEADFGTEIAAGVSALTKNTSLPKAEQMKECLSRIRAQPEEIWMVKLADRITNLDDPPHYWSKDKCRGYREEAELILESLGKASATLSERMKGRMHDYRRHEA
jgi:(p)ppGpp synthase/HD superfamily hydrolase